MHKLNKCCHDTNGLTQKYIGTAYDNVKLVADNLDTINKLVRAVDNGLELIIVIYEDTDLEVINTNYFRMARKYKNKNNFDAYTDYVFLPKKKFKGEIQRDKQGKIIGEWKEVDSTASKFVDELTGSEAEMNQDITFVFGAIKTNHIIGMEATDTKAGIVKLYVELGDNTDGTITQKALTEIINLIQEDTQYAVDTANAAMKSAEVALDSTVRGFVSDEQGNEVNKANSQRLTNELIGNAIGAIKHSDLNDLNTGSAHIAEAILDKSGKTQQQFNDDVMDIAFNAGYGVVGSFEEGLISVSSLNNTKQIITITRNKIKELYSWRGKFPKNTIGTSPESDGGIWSDTNPDGLWVNVGDGSLRGELIQNNGSDILYAISKTKYKKVGNFKRGATLNDEAECLKFGNFYYAYAGSSEYPIVITENSEPDSSWVCVGDANMNHESHTIFNFGGKDDNGKTDNREAIQLAVLYMEHCGSKLHTDSSGDGRFFHIKSKHPNNELDTCIHISKPRKVNIFGGRNRDTSIIYSGSESVDSIIRIYSGVSDWGMRIESLGIHGGFKSNYIVRGDNQWYAQNIFTGGCYEGALLAGIRISTWMCTMNRVYTPHTGKYGIEFVSPESAPNQAATSINLINCFARNVSDAGFHVECTLWYSNWSNNGCDGVDVYPEFAYKFSSGSDSITLENNGSENAQKYLYMRQPRSVKISGIRCASMHPKEDSSLITFDSAYHVELENLGPYDNNKFAREIDILAATGNEYIGLDSSFNPEKLRVSKVEGRYFVYPDVFFYKDNANSGTRGLTKLDSTIHIGDSEIIIKAKQNEIIKKTFIIRRSTTDVQKTLMTFVDTYNANVVFTGIRSGGAGVNNAYSAESNTIGLGIQNGVMYWSKNHETNGIIKLTNHGKDIIATLDAYNYSIVILECKIVFGSDANSRVDVKN